MDSKGFTLLELLVVLLILSALAAFAIPNFMSYKGKAAAVVEKMDNRSTEINNTIKSLD